MRRVPRGPDPRAGGWRGGTSDTRGTSLRVSLCGDTRTLPRLGRPPRARGALCAGAAAPRRTAGASPGAGDGPSLRARGAGGARSRRGRSRGAPSAVPEGAGRAVPGAGSSAAAPALPRGRGAGRCGALRRGRRHRRHRSRMTKHGGAVRVVPQHRARAAPPVN